MSSCELLHDRYAYSMQLLLAVLALLTLAVKRARERPRRSVGQWFMDTSKQGLGALVVHICNVLLAERLVWSTSGDECAMYFVVFVIDVIIGVCIMQGFLLLAAAVAHSRGWKSLQRSGYYGTPLQMDIYGKQLALFIAIILVTKLILAGVEYAFKTELKLLADWMFQDFSSRPKLELFLVMLGGPVVLNTIQYWIVDGLIADHPSSSSTSTSSYRYSEIRQDDSEPPPDKTHTGMPYQTGSQLPADDDV